jgi:hypothetical protein
VIVAAPLSMMREKVVCSRHVVIAAVMARASPGLRVRALRTFTATVCHHRAGSGMIGLPTDVSADPRGSDARDIRL